MNDFETRPGFDSPPDFELRRRLRELAAPRAPATDLWPSIATRIATEGAAVPLRAPTRRRWPAFAAAAGLLLALTGALLPGLLGRGVDRLTDRDAARPFDRQALTDTARAPADDPRLLAATIVLDSANAELEHALEQRPDAVFLVGLINRTHARRLKLEQLGERTS